ncbi:MAG: phosphoenolpyruvate synthase [Actinobacteria bacterium]|nr:phosphoenolpyruvate synthase [Actinomycetota bacterium]
MRDSVPSSDGSQPALVLPLEALEADMLPLVGGKAANLGRMTRAGLPVPAGFCLTTRAYPGAPLTGADEPAAIRTRILEAPIPALVEEAVTEAYRRLGTDVPVAVRSSATAEDLPDASFAGQQDTVLGVVGPRSLLDALRRCWASLWSDRAVTYRNRNGVDPAGVSMAVVVQRMIDAEVAGVMFTADPVTGHRGRVVIDAGPGLGEAVVSGAVNPDHFVVGSRSEIVERRLGDKRVAIRSVPGGGTERVQLRDQRGSACLSQDQVRALAALGRRVEALYGAPQDTEWAIDRAGRAWLTQARPITTLYPLPAGATEDPLRVYFSFNVAQGVTRPLTPMSRSVFRVMGSGLAGLAGHGPRDVIAGPAAMAEAGERLFLDLTPALRTGEGRLLLTRGLSLAETRSAAVVRGLLTDDRLSLVPGSRRRLLRGAATAVLRSRAPATVLRALLDPEALRARHRRVPERLRAAAVGSPADPLDRVQRLAGAGPPAVVGEVAPAVFLGMGLFELAGRLLRGLATGDERQTVLRSVPDNVTTGMDLELFGLARRLHREPETARLLLTTPAGQLAERYRSRSLPPTLQRGLDDFLGAYGHRAVAEVDLGLPRWSEDPTHILGVLANYLRLDDPEGGPDTRFEHGRASAEAMVTELTRRARARGRVRGAMVGFCLRRARALAGVREMPKFCMVVLLGEVRRLLRAVGDELAATGRLESAQDIFFLRLDEARQALGGRDVRDLVRERRRDYDRELRRRHVPRILLSDGTEPEAGTTPSGDGLRGTPASAGVANGRARVVLDPVGARLEPGQILVAPSTDPGWTPLFLTAGGLVMEMGGAMSHGAVVAREYGIPAVVGVTGATDRIADGQRVAVDGSAGIVEVGEPG